MSSGSLTERGTVAAPLREQAVNVAQDVARRLCDENIVAEAVKRTQAAVAPPDFFYWCATGTFEGPVGIALALSFFDRCFPDQSWDKSAHKYLTIGVNASNEMPNLDSGLSMGLAGIAFTARELSRGGKRYSRLLENLDLLIVQRTQSMAASIIKFAPNCPFSVFDVVSGLSGMLSYLLGCHPNQHIDEAVRAALHALVSISRFEGTVPLWYTPLQFLPALQKPHCANGNINCGLAHGIPGPLAVMSLAKSKNYDVSGLVEAIRLVSDWLVENRTKPESDMDWPYFVPLVSNQNELTPDTTSSLAPSKTAWCYGSPGVAKALWFAGKALDDKSLIDLSIAAIKKALAKSPNERHISGVSLCHGNAGLLQLALRFGRDCEDTELLDYVSGFVQQIVDEYDETSILGFRIPNSVGGYFDRPSFLEGTAGAVLALLSATTEIEPTWDRILLMS